MHVPFRLRPFAFCPRLVRPARHVLLLAGLMAVAACSNSSNSSSTSGVVGSLGDPTAGYGAELIGYKVKEGNDPDLTAATPAAAGLPQPANAAAPGLAPPSAPTGFSGAPAGPVAMDEDFNGAATDDFDGPEPDPSADDGDTGDVATDDEQGPTPAPSITTPLDAGAPRIEADGGTGDAGPTTPPLLVEAGPTDFELCEIPEFDELPEAQRQPENPFRATTEMAASTFSIDVDTGSYTLARAAINAGTLPRPETVRIEEFINYFHLHYAQPKGDTPFSFYSELGDCPWNAGNQLLMLGIQGQEVLLEDQPAANLVFLLDVSGSMGEPGKLSMLQKGFRMITRQLRDIDTVSIVTYSTTVRLHLPATSGANKETILSAINVLRANGSTAGEAGIQMAYDVAQEHFIQGGNNRVLLATDGDFNVGINDVPSLSEFIAEKRDTGVFLSVYGFGSPTGNFQDEVAEQLADNGNGVYFFVDSPEEARRAFVHTLTGSLLTVAKDVKLQLQFNPSQVKGYRLIGYENRVLNNSDFANDSVDAGELGAGLSVTALFELIPSKSENPIPSAAPGTDPLRDDTSSEEAQLDPITGDDMLEVRVRYKGADEDQSKLLASRLKASDIVRAQPTLKFSFASGVAEFAMQLRGSQYLPQRRDLALLDQIESTLPADDEGAVNELLTLISNAYEL